MIQATRSSKKNWEGVVWGHEERSNLIDIIIIIIIIIIIVIIIIIIIIIITHPFLPSHQTFQSWDSSKCP